MRTIAVALALSLTAATLPAAEPLAPGTPVRIRGDKGLRIEGTLTALGERQLTIATRTPGEKLTLDLDRIERLQVGGRRNLWAGFGRGAVAGMGAAVVFSLASVGECDSGDCFLLYAYLLGFLTVPLGAIVGTIFAPRDWNDVVLPRNPTPAKVSVDLRAAPVRGGARFALSVGF